MKKFWQLLLQALNGKDLDYTQLPLRRAIFLLAIPMVIEMMMESIFAVVDAYYVGSLGDVALATVGLTESVLMIIYSVGMGISMAATALVARRVGEKNYHEAGTAAFQLIYTAFFASLLLSGVCFFFAEEILRLMGASEQVIDYGIQYTRWTFLFNIVIIFLFMINGIFRGAGTPRIAMQTLIIANGLNLVLDPLFIFGIGDWEGWGLEGAAIATITGRSIGVLYQFYHLLNGKHYLRIVRTNLKIRYSEIKQIISISSGGMGQFLIDSASWILLSRIVASFGDEAVAGYTIAFRVIIFTILPSWGLSGAAATLVGQNLGAHQPDRAEQSVWKTARYNMIFLGAVMVLFFLFGRNIASLFASNPNTVGIANEALTIITSGYVFFGLGMVMVQAFNGAGDTRTPMFINILVLWVLEVPLAYTMAIVLEWGWTGVFVAVAICHSIHALVSYFWFKRGKWKEVKV